jgi:hypothetical protein
MRFQVSPSQKKKKKSQDGILKKAEALWRVLVIPATMGSAK